MSLIDVLECAGSISSVAGAWLLALKFRYSKFGWCAYLLANFFLIGFDLALHRQWLIFKDCSFTLSSLVGVWNYVICDKFSQLPTINLDWLTASRVRPSKT